jgi:hypothetical protein
VGIFRDRLWHYARHMKWTQDTFAHILEHKTKGRVAAWMREVDTRQPSADQIFDIAERLCISLDWLLGRETVDMWSPDVHAARLYLRSHLSGVHLDTPLERVKYIVHLLGERLPQLAHPHITGGILGLNTKEYERFTSGQPSISQHTIHRLAEFTLIPDAWFWSETAPSPLALGEYEEAVLRLNQEGVTGRDLLAQVPSITQRKAQITGLINNA